MYVHVKISTNFLRRCGTLLSISCWVYVPNTLFVCWSRLLAFVRVSVPPEECCGSRKHKRKWRQSIERGGQRERESTPSCLSLLLSECVPLDQWDSIASRDSEQCLNITTFWLSLDLVNWCNTHSIPRSITIGIWIINSFQAHWLPRSFGFFLQSYWLDLYTNTCRCC